MRFTRAELEAFRGCEVDDLVGPGLKLLFVGINPGLWTAAVGTHFAHPPIASTLRWPRPASPATRSIGSLG